MKLKIPAFWFNWPSRIGGADTKFLHLLPLLGREFGMTVVPNDPRCLRGEWAAVVRGAGAGACARGKVPKDLRGSWAVSMCNRAFFKSIAGEMKKRGARIAWSNDMMWLFDGEAEAVRDGTVDCVMYVSRAQREALEPKYLEALGLPWDGPLKNPCAKSGAIRRKGLAPLRWVMTGNWIDPGQFPHRARGVRGEGDSGVFTIGRVSRPDPDKFPYDFPASYERMGLREPVKFRVLGWSDGMRERWCEHRWDRRWDLLEADSVPVADFLDTLDVLVYDVSPRFKESWGRAVVEAMLSGVVPLVPQGGGHHLENLLEHGKSGFLCRSRTEYGEYCRALQDDPALLGRMSREARRFAVKQHCNRREHLALWRKVFRSN